MVTDSNWYLLAFVALSPIFWFLGSTFNLLSGRFMRTQVVNDGSQDSAEVRTHGALSSLAALLGTLFYFAAAAGGFFVAVAVGIAAFVLLLLGGTLLLLIMVPVMCGSFLMSLIIEPMVARSERSDGTQHAG